MSLKVTIEEEPRVFSVLVGAKRIGRVTSYFEKGEDNDEAYEAERYVGTDGVEYVPVGQYGSLKDAGSAVVEDEHGYDGKIDKVTERIV